MNDKLRIAMVGAGSMANRVHYPSLASFPDVEMVAACDLNISSLNDTADRYGITGRYTDYRKMIEDTAPNAVYVIGPPNNMYDIWVWCLQQKLNLFIEKPMGISLHQARNLAYLAGVNDCLTQVGFQRRACPMLARLHQECLNRGPIVHAVCEFYKNELRPMLTAQGHMMDDAVHAIDTLRFLCGGEIVGIEPVTGRVGTPDINLIIALLRFDTGATGVLINSWTSGRRVFRVQMHGNGICAEVDPEGAGALFADGDVNGVRFDTQVVADSDQFYVYGGFQAKNREFIDGVKSHKQPPSCFADALKTMEVAEKILAFDALK